MSPHRALRAATLSGAEYIGMGADLGSIEPGKLADLVVVDGNPLADIRVSERVALTVLNGRVYDAATMNELTGSGRERRAFFWESEPGASLSGAGVGTQEAATLPRAGEACRHGDH